MRLLKEEIGTVNARVLNARYCELLQESETLPAKDIPIADVREILWIEDELRKRLIKFVGHNLYPPDRIEKEHPSNYMISLLKPAKPEPKPDAKIKFKITVTSSIGSKVAEKTIHVDSRYEADLLANKLIRDLGLKRASYKIS